MKIYLLRDMRGRDPKNVAVRGLKTKNGKKASCDKLKTENLT